MSKKLLSLAGLSQAYDQLKGADRSIVQNAVQSGRLRWRSYAEFLGAFKECGGQMDQREVGGTIQTIHQLIADSRLAGHVVLTPSEMASAEDRARKLRQLMTELEGVQKEKRQKMDHALRSGSHKVWAQYDALGEREGALRADIEALERQDAAGRGYDGDHRGVLS